MMLDALNRILRCPTCGADLVLLSLADGDVPCSCSARYRMEAGILEFGVEEQRYANQWSSRTTKEEFDVAIERWIASGMFTRADLDHGDVNADAARTVLAKGVARLQDAIASVRSGIAVDLCTGMGGIFTREMVASLPAGAALVATDLSRKVLGIVRERLCAPQNIAFLACDARNLPIRTGTIDVVTGNAALSNIEGGSTALGEANRVLAPGGRVALNETMFSPGSRSVRWYDEFFSADNMFTRDRMLGGFARAGFSDVRVETLFSGVTHLRGDALPLVGDAADEVIVSARKG